MTALRRCEIIPEPGHQVRFLVDGREATRWHFAPTDPRPCFYPLVGPESGRSITRMGHPGAENHDHHRSVWFAHHKVLGIDFWGIGAESQVRQRNWYVYDEADDAARMAVRLDWLDGHDPKPLIEQELVAILKPLAVREFTLELQSTFRPNADEIEFQMSNFGFLGIRVARTISAHFGEGTITSSTGLTGEKAIFGTAAEWMDYSGPMPTAGESGALTSVVEGITCFDHPDNPSYPVKWHVREDGWMGPSACRDSALITTREQPLRLRYLLHVHRGPIDAYRAAEVAAGWHPTPWLQVVKSSQPHRQFELQEA
ncbi:MAG: PmoA family protein [Planctomycetaceae bacterium]|nr:PmoA family protein [Planctomycetaceae bacterium]